MHPFKELRDTALSDTDIHPQELPRLDLYMDQILTLLNDGLSDNKRHPNEKLITKTMIHNYSKEHLISPVKGKKYSREQLIQLLCILNLKQTLSLTDLKTLVSVETEQVDFESAYLKSLELKERLQQSLPDFLNDTFGDCMDLSNPEMMLSLTLALSSGAIYLKRICEGIIDDANLQLRK